MFYLIEVKVVTAQCISIRVKVLQNILLLNYFLHFFLPLVDDSHPCARNNGSCSHLCLINPTGHSCICVGAGSCQTSVSSSASITSGMNTATAMSYSSTTHATATSTEIHASASVSLSISSPMCSSSSSMTYHMVTEHAHTTTVNFSPSPVAPTATRVSLTPSQTPSDICASQNPCEDRGSCQADVIEGYKCVCLEYFIGQDCSIDISMLFSLVVIVFVFLCNCHKRGK